MHHPLTANVSTSILGLLVITCVLVPSRALANPADDVAVDGDTLVVAAANRKTAADQFMAAAGSIDNSNGLFERNPGKTSEDYSKAAQEDEIAGDQYQRAASDCDEAAKKYENAAQLANDPRQPDKKFSENASKTHKEAKKLIAKAKTAYKDGAIERDKAAVRSGSYDQKAQQTATAAQDRELAIHKSN